MLKAGRYTAAILLILVGAGAIADQTAGTHILLLLAAWWPMLFVLLGVECLWLNRRYKDSGRPVQLDIFGVVIAIAIAAVVLAVRNAAGFSS